MYRDPALWHGLMERLTSIMITYLRAKVEAGVDALQLFDSWVGALSPRDYAEYVQPYSRRILRELRQQGSPREIPLIHFGTNTATLLDLIKGDGGSTIGVDWRIPLDIAWERIGYASASRATSMPPRCTAQRASGRAAPWMCCNRPRADPATSSTWATASCPTSRWIAWCVW